MADIEKILDNLNLPKQLLDKSEALLKTLFGPSFEEAGGMIADQVRLRRFKNQISIFSKAQEKLRQSSIDPQKISLKVLAPMIEFSSLEEEPDIQDKWSNLIAHILGGDKELVFQQNCITILSKLASEEANLIDRLHDFLLQRIKENHAKISEQYEAGKVKYPLLYKTPPNLDEYSLGDFTFNINQLSKDIHIAKVDLEFSVSNLISLGLLKWETDVQVEAAKSSEDPEDIGIDVDVNVYNNVDFVFTSMGSKFVRTCKN